MDQTAAATGELAVSSITTETNKELTVTPIATATPRFSGKWSKYPKRYRKEWESEEELRGWIQEVPDNEKKALCRFCHRTLRAHKNDLLKHAMCPKHKRRMSEVRVVTLHPKILEILEKSKSASKTAYCPYSCLPVGAAVLCEDGTIVTGCNIENASYGLSICAERSAVFKAVSQGHRKFTAIAVSASNTKNEFIGPCGACRQVLAEFGTSWDVYITKPDLSFQKWTVGQLLPQSFTPDCLNVVGEKVNNFEGDEVNEEDDSEDRTYGLVQNVTAVCVMDTDDDYYEDDVEDEQSPSGENQELCYTNDVL